LDLNSSKPFNGRDNQRKPTGRLIALDLGARRVGVAISDELQITASPLPFIERRSWKDLLRRVSEIIEGYDARALVIGLPLGLDGTEGEAAGQARETAENFGRSLDVPVYLQDERLTTFAARSEMRSEGVRAEEIERRIDSESAAMILRDFMESQS
jgi:putative Holliday junction resolvase